MKVKRFYAQEARILIKVQVYHELVGHCGAALGAPFVVQEPSFTAKGSRISFLCFILAFGSAFWVAAYVHPPALFGNAWQLSTIG